MRRNIGSLLVTLLACATALHSAESGSANDATSGQVGTSDKEIALIKKVEEERVQAGVRKDVEAIAADTAEDYLQIDLDGKVWDKTAAMRRIQSPEITDDAYR